MNYFKFCFKKLFLELILLILLSHFSYQFTINRYRHRIKVIDNSYILRERSLKSKVSGSDEDIATGYYFLLIFIFFFNLFKFLD